MFKELKNKSNQELGELVVRMKSKLLEYRFRIASGDSEDIHKIKVIRKTIARVLTLLKQRNVILSISNNDLALIEVKDGKMITKSFKKKGANTIVFDEESKTKKQSLSNSNISKELKSNVIKNSEKKSIVKKITITSNKKTVDSSPTTVRKVSSKG